MITKLKFYAHIKNDLNNTNTLSLKIEFMPYAYLCPLINNGKCGNYTHTQQLLPHNV